MGRLTNNLSGSSDSVKAGRQKKILWLRIGTLLVLVTSLVLLLISYLNYSNYRKSYLELSHARYLTVARDLRQTVVAGLNIGLLPMENARLSPSIHEVVQRDKGIRFIAIAGETGNLISEGAFSRQEQASWRGQLLNTAIESHWQASDADTYQIGVPFVNNFNIKAGAVVVGYDKAVIDGAMNDMVRNMAIDMGITLGTLAALTLAGVFLLTRKFSAELASVGDTLDSALTGATPQQVEGEYLSGSEAQDINDVTALSHRVIGGIAQLESELMRTIHIEEDHA